MEEQTRFERLRRLAAVSEVYVCIASVCNQKRRRYASSVCKTVMAGGPCADLRVEKP